MIQNNYVGQMPKILAFVLLLAGCSGSENFQPWMSSDVKDAWDAGYKGKSATIIVVDEYDSDLIDGNLTGVEAARSHGDWTAQQSSMIAPEASVRQLDYFNDANTSYALSNGLNVINNSYGIDSGSPIAFGNFDVLEQTTISHARNGTAVVVKAAGNDSVAVDARSGAGNFDALNLVLQGAPTNIFVGALTKNGTPSDKARLADYSNFAGSDPAIQDNFLVVGVDEGQTGLAGTSFAAPIVSGYAAILGSKFTNATPTQITNQLLDTARTDTIQGYSRDIHGRGEASLGRALAPRRLD